MIITGKHSVIIILLAFFAAVVHLYGQEGSPLQRSSTMLSSAVADSSSPGLSITLPYVPEEIPSSPWSVGADLLSSYIWRGTRQGSGPHIQPAIEFSRGSFTAGGMKGDFGLSDGRLLLYEVLYQPGVGHLLMLWRGVGSMRFKCPSNEQG